MFSEIVAGDYYVVSQIDMCLSIILNLVNLDLDIYFANRAKVNIYWQS